MVDDETNESQTKGILFQPVERVVPTYARNTDGTIKMETDEKGKNHRVIESKSRHDRLKIASSKLFVDSWCKKALEMLTMAESVPETVQADSEERFLDMLTDTVRMGDNAEWFASRANDTAQEFSTVIQGYIDPVEQYKAKAKPKAKVEPPVFVNVA